MVTLSRARVRRRLLWKRLLRAGKQVLQIALQAQEPVVPCHQGNQVRKWVLLTLHLACFEFIFRPRAGGSTALWLMPCVRASGTGVIGTRVLRSRLMCTKVLSDK